MRNIAYNGIMSDIEQRIFELHAEICKVLSHPKRLEIIEVLRGNKQLGVGELAARLKVTNANVSQHLALMRKQNIVKTQRQGNTILYSLANPKILVAYDALRKTLREQLESSGKLLERF